MWYQHIFSLHWYYKVAIVTAFGISYKFAFKGAMETYTKTQCINTSIISAITYFIMSSTFSTVAGLTWPLTIPTIIAIQWKNWKQKD